MTSRNIFKTMLAVAVTAMVLPAADSSIQLHCDLAVDAAKEKQFLDHFEHTFKPAGVKFPGYIDVKVVKLRSAPVGKAPAGLNYRFILQYQSEELRMKWVNSDVHKKVWPPIEGMLSNKAYTCLLFDSKP